MKQTEDPTTISAYIYLSLFRSRSCLFNDLYLYVWDLSMQGYYWLNYCVCVWFSPSLVRSNYGCCTHVIFIERLNRNIYFIWSFIFYMTLVELFHRWQRLHCNYFTLNTNKDCTCHCPPSGCVSLKSVLDAGCQLMPHWAESCVSARSESPIWNKENQCVECWWKQLRERHALHLKEKEL